VENLLEKGVVWRVVREILSASKKWVAVCTYDDIASTDGERACVENDKGKADPCLLTLSGQSDLCWNTISKVVPTSFSLHSFLNGY